MSIDQTTLRTAILTPDAAIPEGLVDGQGNPAGRRFAVYRNNVAVSLTEALETGFPVIAKLLGEANCKAVAGQYLRADPPSSPLMMHYGAGLPGFLADFPPLRHLGYLADVARLELAIRRSYHAADAAPIDPAALGELSPEALMTARIGIAPSVEIVTSAWPIFDIWRFNTQTGAPKPQAVAQDVAVLRPDYDPAPHLLPPGGARFVAQLRAGASLGTAHETALAEAEGFDLGQTLALLLGGGALTTLKTGDTP